MGGHWQFFLFSLVFVGDVFPVWMSSGSGVSSAAASETSSAWLSLGGQASRSRVCPRQEPVVGVWAAGSTLVTGAERVSGGAACGRAHGTRAPGGSTWCGQVWLAGPSRRPNKKLSFHCCHARRMSACSRQVMSVK